MTSHTNGSHAAILSLAVATVLAATSLTSVSAAPAVFARVGRTTGTPEHADGHFRSFGWSASTAFCGMRDANLPGAPFIGKDASWWLTYNHDALFVAFLAVLKPHGENYLAKATANDDPAILEDDDRLVIQVALSPKVGEAGVPFLRLAVNPNGAVWAATIEALPGQNHPLDTSKIAVGNHVGPHHVPGHWWIVRVRIPLELLGVKNLDGRTARVHLAWATTPLYLSWGGVKADDWQNMPEVVFDPAPRAAFRLNGSYPFLLGTGGGINLDCLGNVFTGTAEKPLDYRLVMTNEAGGKVTWEKRWERRKAAGESVQFSGGENMAGVAREGNVLTINAVTSLDGQEQTLFSGALPFQPKQPTAEAALKEWAALHAYALKARAGFDRIYDPYSDRLDVLVATGLNPQLYADAELDKARRIVAADRVRVVVADDQGAAIAKGEGAVANGAGNAVVQLPRPLPEGDYTIKAELLHRGEVADRADLPFTRRRFEWETANIGREKVIIPPWEPITVNGDRLPVTADESGQSSITDQRPPVLTCWGRTYAVQNNGLPAAMVSQGADVLGGPMRLTGVVDGKAVAAQGETRPRITLIPGTKFPAEFANYELATNACPVAGKDFELERTSGYAAEVKASSKLGAVAVQMHSRLDYDGLYTTRLTLTPAGGAAAQVDALALTVPIADSANLYRLSRMLDVKCLGRIPDGEGVLQKSSNLPAHPALAGTFVPVVFAGQYDHGLFWMAESDRGWSVDDTDDQVLLVRENGELALKFRFIARPTTLDQPRTIEFAFIATPSRPKAVGYRQAFWQGKRMHDTAGFRFYGGGVNGFQLYTPEDYEGLRKYIYESDGISRHYLDKRDTPPGHNSYYKIVNEMAKQGYPVTLYGCSWGANAGMREFPTFGSAWIHTAATGRPMEEFRNWTNFGHSVKWSTPEELTPVYALMSDSFVDAWLWHMVRIGQFSGVNGCFFDCFESLPQALRGRVKTDIDGVAYRREDGRLQPFANPLRYHERTRRYATALWLIGRPPSLLQSNNFDNNYGPTWYVEGDMYHERIGRNLIAQGITPDVAAAYTASCSGMGMVRSDVPTVVPEKVSAAEEQCFAVLGAYGILHDLPWSGTPSWLSTTVKTIGAAMKEIPLGDPRVRHLRYWNADDSKLVRASDPRVLAGGFVHPEKTCAVIAVLNSTDQKLEVALKVGEGLLAGPVTGLRDVLAAADLAASPRLVLEPHGVKVLLVK